MVLQRIKEYIDSKGISPEEFEECINMPGFSLCKSLENRSTIDSDILEKILNVYKDLSAEWLLTGQGSMYKGLLIPDVGSIDSLLHSYQEIAESIGNLSQSSNNISLSNRLLSETNSQLVSKLAELMDELKETRRELTKYPVSQETPANIASDVKGEYEAK